jgi:hypothetical protein
MEIGRMDGYYDRMGGYCDSMEGYYSRMIIRRMGVVWASYVSYGKPFSIRRMDPYAYPYV